MSKLTLKEQIAQAKEDIQKSKMPTYLIPGYGGLYGTLYLKEKMDYGFHIYFIHEPNSKNPLAGVNGTLSEMYYDLRNKKYFIKRNLKEVKFSVRNIDAIFGVLNREERSGMFDWLSTDANKGLYQTTFNILGAMDREVSDMYGRFFHRLITEYNFYELLYKAKIDISKISYFRGLNKQGKNPQEVLNISKSQWKMMRKYDLSPSTFEHKPRNNSKADRELSDLLKLISELEDEFGITKMDDFINKEIDTVYNPNDGWNRCVVWTANRYNLNLKKLIRYIYFECDVSQGINASSAISVYKDYVRMTVEMGYEKFDKYPRFLKTFHDIASRNYKVNIDDIQKAKWKEVYQSHHSKFRHSVDGYKVFAPEEPSDLIREGNLLSHCVSSYVNKVISNTSTILFLREVDDIDTPLVTIEVRGEKITQARGKMNNPPTVQQKQAINKFAKKYNLTYGGY